MNESALLKTAFPSPGDLWASVSASVAVLSLALWLVQKAWLKLSGEKDLSFSSAFMYSLGVLLEDPPSEPPRNLSARVRRGWIPVDREGN